MEKQKNQKSDEKENEEKIVNTPKVQEISEPKKSEVQKIKKDEAKVNIQNAPISTKYAIDICKFIKNKSIKKAINDLEQVLTYKKSIPMRGGFGHQKSAKGFASGSGKYPQNTAKYFITLLKSLSANSTANGLDNPIIVEAFGNVGQQPRAKFGRWERKRTHLKLVAKEKKTLNKKENKKSSKDDSGEPSQKDESKKEVKK
ncbi:MAG: uL22 family ribosomal protein [Nanoarchaeota archaeon]